MVGLGLVDGLVQDSDGAAVIPTAAPQLCQRSQGMRHIAARLAPQRDALGERLLGFLHPPHLSSQHAFGLTVLMFPSQ